MQQIPKGWTEQAADILTRMSEDLLNSKQGSLKKHVKEAAMKVAGKFTLTTTAAALGTAGTGTAISSLSGAAAHSATLAWFGGGSMLLGEVVLGTLAIGGATLGLRWLYGAPRTPKDLSGMETKIYSRCITYAAYFASKGNDGGEELALSPDDINACWQLHWDVRNYLDDRDECKSRHVRNRLNKSLAEWYARISHYEVGAPAPQPPQRGGGT